MDRYTNCTIRTVLLVYYTQTYVNIYPCTSNKDDYSRIKSTKSPSFCTATFSACLTNLTVRLPQSRDSSCYVSRPILAPPPLWLQQHTDLRAHDFAHSADLWHQPRLANVTCALRLRYCAVNPAVVYHCQDSLSFSASRKPLAGTDIILLMTPEWSRQLNGLTCQLHSVRKWPWICYSCIRFKICLTEENIENTILGWKRRIWTTFVYNIKQELRRKFY
jgi:hypothetical protein